MLKKKHQPPSGELDISQPVKLSWLWWLTVEIINRVMVYCSLYLLEQEFNNQGFSLERRENERWASSSSSLTSDSGRQKLFYQNQWNSILLN